MGFVIDLHSDGENSDMFASTRCRIFEDVGVDLEAQTRQKSYKFGFGATRRTAWTRRRNCASRATLEVIVGA
jgi:hypothetical protein